ncbi:MAG: hypothetical protein RL291_756, partial [Pseudomonadota bacterium]
TETETEDDEDGPVTGSPHVIFAGPFMEGGLFGTAGDDSMTGSRTDETIFSALGDDRIQAGDGDDIVFSGSGNDTAAGGAGNDRIFTEDGNDMVFGGDGADYIRSGSGNDEIWGDDGDDIVDAGAGRDVIFATRNDGNDSYDGGDGIDTIDYRAAQDNMVIDLGRGYAQSNDTGEDVLINVENVIGGAGSDTIYANNAINILNGGGGDDTFVFRTAASAKGDVIEGFQLGDKISLSAIFNDNNGLNVGTGATFNPGGQVLLVNQGDDTLVRGDTNGDGAADFTITVKGAQVKADDIV